MSYWYRLYNLFLMVFYHIKWSEKSGHLIIKTSNSGSVVASDIIKWKCQRILQLILLQTYALSIIT